MDNATDVLPCVECEWHNETIFTLNGRKYSAGKERLPCILLEVSGKLAGKRTANDGNTIGVAPTAVFITTRHPI
jgi:hypothetical protein